ncbi:MAG: hypothetical protein KKD77_23355 [Gammaproteobacteria bacterium]|nr:hypothetical protein [Gammaproteobacteria bacterium]
MSDMIDKGALRKFRKKRRPRIRDEKTAGSNRRLRDLNIKTFLEKEEKTDGKEN